MTKKLKLNDLKIQSFVTKPKTDRVNGGYMIGPDPYPYPYPYPETYECPPDTNTCPSAYTCPIEICDPPPTYYHCPPSYNIRCGMGV